ncbi:hypothetical protein BV25DRAFT_1822345 [Artomyces pyxidatus]|uniref:Uncharacterized protein n=1 Tax=Artomyces pyxidatus TaxID=48021 RepID=A0ACB8T9L1_9AGAM|nr:hypothetical protein BV25DRAFT_1822345 [Artomyces pyxidatus]
MSNPQVPLSDSPASSSRSAPLPQLDPAVTSTPSSPVQPSHPPPQSRYPQSPPAPQRDLPQQPITIINPPQAAARGGPNRRSYSPPEEVAFVGAEDLGRTPSGIRPHRRQSTGNGYPRRQLSYGPGTTGGPGGGGGQSGYSGAGGGNYADATGVGMGSVGWIVPEERRARRPMTVGERLQPTIQSATTEKEQAELQAKMTGYSLNIAIGLQVLIGALTTALGAALSGKQTSVAISILGGSSTLLASYLARARGSNEPEASMTRVRALAHFLREVRGFELDHGHEVGSDFDAQIDAFRVGLERLLGNAKGVGFVDEEDDGGRRGKNEHGEKSWVDVDVRADRSQSSGRGEKMV